ncbi:hypothetical protein [Gynuella sp.]|uniref:hypothetical protein n=1 Tax=Gynuella sp. TaxID=2969146 RepID=UPI003D0A2DAC
MSAFSHFQKNCSDANKTLIFKDILLCEGLFFGSRFYVLAGDLRRQKTATHGHQAMKCNSVEQWRSKIHFATVQALILKIDIRLTADKNP